MAGIYLGAWFTTLQIVGPLSLLLIGIYFPERWRVDLKLPWVKWVLLVPALAALAVILWLHGGRAFQAPANHWGFRLNPWINWHFNPINLICVLLYWVAIFDNYAPPQLPDARRRIRSCAQAPWWDLGLC